MNFPVVNAAFFCNLKIYIDFRKSCFIAVLMFFYERFFYGKATQDAHLRGFVNRVIN